MLNAMPNRANMGMGAANGPANILPRLNSFVTNTATNAANAAVGAANAAAGALNFAANAAANTVANVANTAANTMTTAANATANAAARAMNNIPVVGNVGSLPKIANSTNRAEVMAAAASPFRNGMGSMGAAGAAAGAGASVVLTVGVLAMLAVLIAIFYQQIIDGAQRLWTAIQNILGLSVPSQAPPDPVPIVPEGPVPPILPGRKEVFTTARSIYTYRDAEPLCRAYGAELATYDDVKQAAESGGAAYSQYGWVKGQSAYYVIDEALAKKIQASGYDGYGSTPGIYGGYFDNPELRFSVTCKGVKPEETNIDMRYAAEYNDPPTAQAAAFDQRVLEFKQELGRIPILPNNTATQAWE